MFNFSPIGRNCSREERNDYEKFDLEHGIRQKMVEAMKKEFSDLDLSKFTSIRVLATLSHFFADALKPRALPPNVQPTASADKSLLTASRLDGTRRIA